MKQTDINSEDNNGKQNKVRFKYKLKLLFFSIVFYSSFELIEQVAGTFAGVGAYD